MKKIIDPVDATPIKNVYLSIIHDYDLRSALCELIDNAIDAWRDAKRSDALEIRVSLDGEQQTIRIEDNAGGVDKKDLRVLVSPGAASTTTVPDPIGIFGVGSKRSVVALAGRIEITTRNRDGSTYRLEYDDDWINDESSDWHVPAFEVTPIVENSTFIELTKLRSPVSDEVVNDLKAHLSVTYANYLEDENIWLLINDEQIEPRFFTQWAFPPDYPPTSFSKSIGNNSDGKVKVEITSGLTLERQTLGGDYGVFFYCNRRLVARALRSAEVGFVSGLVGVDHHNMNLARVIVELEGPPRQMPWTSKKDGIYYGHPIFQAIREDIVLALTNCTKWSKALKPLFDSEVKPFSEGQIVAEKLPAKESIKNRMPKPPKVRIDAQETTVALNKPLAYRSPYVKGLYESVIAAEILLRHKLLSQRNRIAWVVLDSTVEIACKEYLANRELNPLGDKALVKLLRLDLHDEVKKDCMKGDPIWNRFAYNYNIRNSFVHRKADASVSDGDIEEFLHDVKRFLTQAFGIQFAGRK